VFTINGLENNYLDISTMDLGIHLIRYDYTHAETGCAYVVEQTIEVVEELNTPIPVCENATTSEITFAWEAVENAEQYKLSFSIGEETETTQIVDATVTSFTLSDLNTNEEVAFNILAANDLCGETEIKTATCRTNDCPNVEVVFSNLQSSYCKNEGMINLQAQPNGGVFLLNNHSINNQLDVANLEAGNHILTYQYIDVSTNCSYTQSANIQIKDVPSKPIVICASTNLQCRTFTWEETENTLSYETTLYINGSERLTEIVTETTFTVCDLIQGDVAELQVLSQNNCGNSEKGVLACTFECSPIQTQILGLTENYCQNDETSSLLQGQPSGGVFSLLDGIPITEWQPSAYEVGFYTLVYTYTAEDGCEYQTTNNLEVLPLPSASFTTYDTTILEGESTTFTAESQENVDYTWYLDGVITANSVEYTFSSTDSGIYSISLEVLSNEGCIVASEPIEVLVEMSTTIETHPFFDSLQIQPNPAKDVLQVFLTSPSPTLAQLQWYNSQGKLVASESLRIEQNGWNHSVDVSNFAVGVYYLHLQTDEGIAVEKVLIVK
ncbi:MAG: T9SS type A sorting domain-containing protein, partial [Chitinophagales bacterium]